MYRSRNKQQAKNIRHPLIGDPDTAWHVGIFDKYDLQDIFRASQSSRQLSGFWNLVCIACFFSVCVRFAVLYGGLNLFICRELGRVSDLRAAAFGL